MRTKVKTEKDQVTTHQSTDGLSPKPKKPFYKRKSFIIIAAVMVLFIAVGTASGNDSDSSSSGDSSESSSTSSKESDITTYDAATYKVGSDMPAGEYYIKGGCYWEVSSDSSGDFDSIVGNDTYSNNAIVTVSDGQYFQFDGTAMSIDDVKPYKVQNGAYEPGTYRVGTDIPAGEYNLEATSSSGSYEVRSSSNPGYDYIVAEDYFETSTYITVSDGQYIVLRSATIKTE